MSGIGTFFKRTAAVICIAGGLAGVQEYLKWREDAALTEFERTRRATTKYWDQAAAATDVCYNWSQLGTYDDVSKKLKEIPTKNVDPDAVMAIQKYAAPGIDRLDNFEHMKAELLPKILLSGAALVLSLGTSTVAEVADIADVADAFDAIDAADTIDAVDAADAVDSVEGLDAITEATDFASDLIDAADLSGVVDATQMAGITDKIDIAGGLEAVAGPTPGRGLLAIGSLVRYNKEQKRIPRVKHVVAYRVLRARNSLQKKYGTPFRRINLNMPSPCR